MNPQNTWLRPRTTKLYLHSPLSERLALLFPDMKLLSLSLFDNGTHVGQEGVGIHLLHGEEMLPFDLDATRFSPVTAGLPIYTALQRAEVAVSMEAFADTERNPTLYFKITLRNDTEAKIADSIGILPRSGKETYMVNQHQEGYSPYRPNYKNWFMLKRTWYNTDEQNARSDKGFLHVESKTCSVRWITEGAHGHQFEASDYFRIDYTLSPGEAAVIFGSLRAEEAPAPRSYDQARCLTERAWKRITDSVKVHPATEDARTREVFLHSAMQCMQMLARYKDSDLIATRQGDVGRFVWPYEGVQILTMLDRIGLSEHTADAYRYYCKRWLVRDGEDRGMIGSRAGWGNFTGSVIYGISEHLLAVDKREEFEEFLPDLLLMRDWIERKRHAPRTQGYEGIFPIEKGSDWAEQAQFWTFTDSHNAMAYRSLSKLLSHFSHPEAERMKEMYRGYSDTVFRIRDMLYRGHEEDRAYILPHELGIPFEDSENYSYYTDGAPYLLYTGFIDPKSRMREQMEAFFRGRGQFSHGLTGRMTSCESLWDEAYFGGYGDVWYTMQSEICWIRAWVAAGEYEKAKETLDAIMTYAMTEEYVIAERYCSVNPWYSPWQPNGSGCARMLEMLLTYYGEIE